MKISNLTNARYLIVAALASANLVLFQNCSNYSGQVGLESTKDLSSIKDGGQSNIGENAGINVENANVSTGSNSSQQNNSNPEVSSVENVNPNGTAAVMNGVNGTDSSDNVIINLDDPKPTIDDVTINPANGVGIVSSGGTTSLNGGVSGISSGNVGSGGSGTMAGISISDDRDEDEQDEDDSHHGEELNSTKDHGSLCSLHSMIDEDPNLPPSLNDKKVIVLTSADANKSLSFGTGPTTGKIYIVYTGSESLHLTSLDYKGGRITICGNIKIDRLTSNGKVKLLFAQALNVEVNGNLSTSKLELSGNLVTEIEVDKKAGNLVKKCHIDNNLNIVSDL